MFIPVAWTDGDANDNYTQWTNHDYIGSFGIKPNGPKNGH